MPRYEDRNRQERERGRGQGPEEFGKQAEYRGQRFENQQPESYERGEFGREQERGPYRQQHEYERGFGGYEDFESAEGRFGQRGGFASRGPERGAFGSHPYEGRYGEYGSGERGEFGRYGERGSFGAPQSGFRERFEEPGRGGEHWLDVGRRQHSAFGGRSQQEFGGYESQGRFTGRGPKNYQRADERIREDICERLTMHPEIDASEVNIEVRNSEVTLTGTVDDRNQKRLAEDVIESIFGVKEVRNQLRVTQRQWGQQQQQQQQERLQQYGTQIPSATQTIQKQGSQQQETKRQDELVGSSKEK